MKFIEDGYEEFCDIGNGYGMFSVGYTNSRIAKVEVPSTDCWPWDAEGFDEKKLGNPIELPDSVCFNLSNGYTLSFNGLMDDFSIKLFNL
jgi:hypothetical protein